MQQDSSISAVPSNASTHTSTSKKASGQRKGSKAQGNRLAKEVHDRRRNAVKESTLTRARYDKLSLQWQEKLVDVVSEAVLKQAANYLTPEDFDSIMEERTASDMCGYPICNNKKQKLDKRFHISLARRKIYDITEQGGYCSKQCMAASKFYRHQLSEEPLYMRDRSKPTDIMLMPLEKANPTSDTLESSLLAGKLDKLDNQQSASEKELMSWYRGSLLAKMNIPSGIAQSNPLQIIEHDSRYIGEDLSKALGELQFADIEGFEPDIDAKKIKRSIKQIKKLSAANTKTMRGPNEAQRKKETGAKKPSSASNDEVLKLNISLKEKDLDNDEPLAGFSSSSESNKDDLDDDSSINTPADNGCFMNLFSEELSGYGDTINSGNAPPLSLFGRMWTLIDRIATKKTIKYLADLKLTEEGSGQLLDAAEYYSSPGDHSMAMRQNLFSDGITAEIDRIRAKLHIDRNLRHEIQMLVSTLELGSKMVVFKKAEQQLLSIVLLLTLARSMASLGKTIEGDYKAAQELDYVLSELGTDRGSMSMVARRFHEPY
ncbi:hypothetical protein GGI25_003737 [Coemansia spiralis]|uniref:RNA polymerase II subunit B1 CTD phosphatase RPAP2 homolog n=2 Tax=Coemansia TaxID=4863 RepID=A0A9W8G1J0_9FUNG|nr:hypothetical protein EDC05_002298 [Coemansia umbellata]KAJ2622482.1 hypothetical protein GGI26_003209 [Coemansia sp. RSA 1358]KAJ2676003.1 hypothetical protein GGI25_003737 [Coemansia spiralis]